MDYSNGSPQDYLIATFRGPDGEFQGVVEDATAVGDDALVVVDFAYSEAPALQIGEKATLHFSGPVLGDEFESAGSVVFQSVDPVRHRYQFQFGPGERATMNLMVNRRAASRVYPTPGRPIELAVRADGGEHIEAVLKDVSATGISFLVSRTEEPRLFSQWALDVSLTIPGAQDPIALRGTVHYRRLSGSAILYGVEFDTKGPSTDAQQRERLAAFIQRCQTEAVVQVRRRAC